MYIFEYGYLGQKETVKSNVKHPVAKHQTGSYIKKGTS